MNAAGRVVRHYASTDQFDAPHDVGNWPWYWFRPLAAALREGGAQSLRVGPALRAAAGAELLAPDLGDAVQHAARAEGPWAYPGKYTVKLTVGGKTFTQPLMVRMDPRVKTPGPALSQQYSLSIGLYDAIVESTGDVGEDRRREEGGAADSVAKELTALDSALDREPRADADGDGGAGGGGYGADESGGRLRRAKRRKAYAELVTRCERHQGAVRQSEVRSHEVGDQ